jgi:small neutral amino acid transporter SnatA (MarC family)
MTLLIGGIVSAFVGFVGFILWFGDFLVLLKGVIPILLLAGGCLAAYIGFDDLQDKLERERQRQEEAVNKAQEEAELARVKAEQYREELEKLKESVRNKA